MAEESDRMNGKKSAIPYLLPPGEAQYRDRHETKAADWIQSWDGQRPLDACIIGIPLSKSSISHSGACFTPAAIRLAMRSFTTYSLEYDIDLQPYSVGDIGDVQMHVTDLAECHRRIQAALSCVHNLLPDTFPVIIGGDHSIMAPSVQAFSDEHPGRSIGLIHFDAHHDARSYEDGGVTNGTPLRTILESGAIPGREIVQIGIRGFMNAKPYTDYIRGHGVTVYTSRDVRNRGIESILQEAIDSILAAADMIYVSFDMDVIDQSYAPGCPAIGAGGITSWDALDAMYLLGRLPQVKAIDFVCIDPNVDVRNVTSRLAVQLMLTLFAGRFSGRTGVS
jgi:formiminoglutamase